MPSFAMRFPRPGLGWRDEKRKNSERDREEQDVASPPAMSFQTHSEQYVDEGRERARGEKSILINKKC